MLYEVITCFRQHARPACWPGRRCAKNSRTTAKWPPGIASPWLSRGVITSYSIHYTKLYDIYAFSRNESTRGKVTLYRGVYPVPFDVTHTDHARVNKEVVDELLRRGTVRNGDLVIITKGDLAGVLGGTNAMKVRNNFV